MSSLGNIIIYETEKPIDSDWPIKKEVSTIGDINEQFKYEQAIGKELKKISKDVTNDLYQEVVMRIETGKYIELRKKLSETTKERYSFFICPFDNDSINHNYEYVIKPLVKSFQFEIQRADEISHVRSVTEVILNAIAKSRFVIADLTDSRPNCYYEVGYAHSIGKPVIILAKEGTERHFDISTYKWNYWNDYKDLKPKIEKELSGLLYEMKLIPH